MKNDKFSLEGKTAIVTGAAGAKGIGRAIALTLAGAGADVVVADVHVEDHDFNLEGTADAVRALGRRSLALKVDISNEKDVDNLISRTVSEFGTIDIMVNNAGSRCDAALDGNRTPLLGQNDGRQCPRLPFLLHGGGTDYEGEKERLDYQYNFYIRFKVCSQTIRLRDIESG